MNGSDADRGRYSVSRRNSRIAGACSNRIDGTVNAIRPARSGAAGLETLAAPEGAARLNWLLISRNAVSTASAPARPTSQAITAEGTLPRCRRAVDRTRSPNSAVNASSVRPGCAFRSHSASSVSQATAISSSIGKKISAHFSFAINR
ncbi:MAG: hypothetical protein ACYC61_30885 [Isosphaeraceae bacterium]